MAPSEKPVLAQPIRKKKHNTQNNFPPYFKFTPFDADNNLSKKSRASYTLARIHSTQQWEKREDVPPQQGLRLGRYHQCR